MASQLQANTVSRSWRKALRFSMRGLIGLVLVISAGLGWAARNARIQREAAAAIWKAGGEVRYDQSATNGRSWWPNWLVN
jgi:hypothetical protein